MEKDGAGDALHVSAMLLRVSTHSTRVVSKARCGRWWNSWMQNPGPSFSRFMLPSPARRCRRVSSSVALLGKEESLARIDSALMRLGIRST